MKILLLSITAGYGHHAAAAALSAALEQRGCECQTLDLLKYVGSGPYMLVDKGYNAATRYIPKPYGFFFNRKSRRTAEQHRTIDSRTVRLTSLKLLRYLTAYRPDAVVCTHVFGAMAMDELKRKGRTTIPTVGLVTDYEFHPYWEDVPEIEYIIVGSEALEYSARRRGIAVERLLPLGIPVAEKYLHAAERGEARRILGLDDRYTVLLMSGSMGYGDMGELAREIAGLGVQMLCVCGKNKHLKAELDYMNLPGVKVYGFADNVNLMMDAADCIVTKPGGLTTTEAMVKRLPMILHSPIPGQEERNLEFLCGMGAAIATTRDFSPAQAISLLRRFDDRAVEMRAACARCVTGDTTARSAAFICQLNSSARA